MFWEEFWYSRVYFYKNVNQWLLCYFKVMIYVKKKKKTKKNLMLGFGKLCLLAHLLLIRSVIERLTAKWCFSLPTSTHFSPSAQTPLRYHNNQFVLEGDKTLGAPSYCSATWHTGSAEHLGEVAESSRAVSHTWVGPAEQYDLLLTRVLPQNWQLAPA